MTKCSVEKILPNHRNMYAFNPLDNRPDFINDVWDSLLSPINDEPLFLSNCNSTSSTFFSLSQNIPQTIPESRNKELILTVGDWTVRNFADIVKVSPSLFSITIQSRDEKEEPDVVPQNQYSTLKYTMKQRIDSSAINTKHIIFSSLRVINYDTEEEITKDGEPVINVSALNDLVFDKETNRLVTIFKFHWNSVSYHHAKQPFCFLVSFFTLVDGARDLLFEAKSEKFSTYARRPKPSERKQNTSTPKPAAIKRILEEPDEQPESKKQKVTLEVPSITIEQPSDDPFSGIMPEYAYDYTSFLVASPVPLQKFLNLIDSVGEQLSTKDREIITQKLNAV
jgi:hypothetical protein